MIVFQEIFYGCIPSGVALAQLMGGSLDRNRSSKDDGVAQHPVWQISNDSKFPMGQQIMEKEYHSVAEGESWHYVYPKQEMVNKSNKLEILFFQRNHWRRALSTMFQQYWQRSISKAWWIMEFGIMIFEWLQPKPAYMTTAHLYQNIGWYEWIWHRHRSSSIFFSGAWRALIEVLNWIGNQF
jgi:hypothetical protein